jgi:hypothetical protein
MAHFARIENGIVVDVIVIANDELMDEAGIESEAIGLAFLAETYGEGLEFVQTSYNAHSNGFRGQYAGLGDVWDGTNFTTPQPQEASAP